MATTVVAGPASQAGASEPPPSTPVLVTPASGGGVNGGPGQLFTVRASVSGNRLYFATIEVSGGTLTPSFTTSAGPSDTHVTGSPPVPVVPGSYMWRARATSTSTTTGVVTADASQVHSGWTAWVPFTVSSPATIGAGVTSGQVTFAGSGLPGALAPCAETSFTFTSELGDSTLPDGAGGVVINIQGHEYAGPIALTGTGNGACANAAVGSGTLSVQAREHQPTAGTFSCNLSGYFTRLVSDVTLALGGTCTINGVTTAPVNFRAQTEFRPDKGAGDGTVLGVDQSVTHALFAGYFTVTPA